MNLAVCGNHKVNYCTESELVWTLEQMGHLVLRFQENHTRTDVMLQHCENYEIQLFLYIHTHGWDVKGAFSMEALLQALKIRGIRTASFHLDRYWGLQLSDQRESRIGMHPFWQTEKVFTADGGHQDAFAQRGVQHHWLPPAIAKRHCFRGTYRHELACDVAFVGAKRYHPEYPFRMQLIAWLEATYGRRFRRFGPDAGGVVREAKLNDLYASAKVVVGDSCFGGSPYYWSDRVPETVGRGGFLLHPKSEGLDIPGLVTFPAGNLNALKTLIDHYVKHDRDRWLWSGQAMEHVRDHDTYHQRMGTVLTEMALV